MDRLWAPWRMQYITTLDEEGCIFCEKPKKHDDLKTLILHRHKKTFIMLNRYPYNNGHLLVAPYRHIKDIHSLNKKELVELAEMVNFSLTLLEDTYHPQGFNVGLNLGRAAGAGVEDHLHIHIVPRWEGDTNFMPVLGDTKIIPQSLEECYRRLKDGIKKTSI